MTDKTKIVKPEQSLNKKLGNIKFDEAFDKTTMSSAEESYAGKQEAFKNETLNDFARMKTVFDNLSDSTLDERMYQRISELAFSIKSRAATGGIPLASEIANSMYKFSDAARAILPKKGFVVLKLHFDSLTSIFNATTYDEAQKSKLVKGLEDVAKKFLEEK